MASHIGTEGLQTLIQKLMLEVSTLRLENISLRRQLSNHGGPIHHTFKDNHRNSRLRDSSTKLVPIRGYKRWSVPPCSSKSGPSFPVITRIQKGPSDNASTVTPPLFPSHPIISSPVIDTKIIVPRDVAKYTNVRNVDVQIYNSSSKTYQPINQLNDMAISEAHDASQPASIQPNGVTDAKPAASTADNALAALATSHPAPAYKLAKPPRPARSSLRPKLYSYPTNNDIGEEGKNQVKSNNGGLETNAMEIHAPDGSSSGQSLVKMMESGNTESIEILNESAWFRGGKATIKDNISRRLLSLPPTTPDNPVSDTESRLDSSLMLPIDGSLAATPEAWEDGSERGLPPGVSSLGLTLGESASHGYDDPFMAPNGFKEQTDTPSDTPSSLSLSFSNSSPFTDHSPLLTLQRRRAELRHATWSHSTPIPPPLLLSYVPSSSFIANDAPRNWVRSVYNETPISPFSTSNASYSTQVSVPDTSLTELGSCFSDYSSEDGGTNTSRPGSASIWLQKVRTSCDRVKGVIPRLRAVTVDDTSSDHDNQENNASPSIVATSAVPSIPDTWIKHIIRGIFRSFSISTKPRNPIPYIPRTASEVAVECRSRFIEHVDSGDHCFNIFPATSAMINEGYEDSCAITWQRDDNPLRPPSPAVWLGAKF